MGLDQKFFEDDRRKSSKFMYCTRFSVTKLFKNCSDTKVDIECEHHKYLFARSATQ